MELIKDIIKVDNRIDFGKFQTFIETEAVVPVYWSKENINRFDIIGDVGAPCGR